MASLWSRFFVVVLCTWSVSAWAQSDPDTSLQGECMVDADCPTDFTCHQAVIPNCGACPDDGSECGCSPPTPSYCVPPPPLPCTANVNCDGDDVCVSYAYDVCSGGDLNNQGCPPDETCPDAEPPAQLCDTQTESYCVPPYVAPCRAAEDCGPGFTCETTELCICASGGLGGEESGECDCEPIVRHYCQMIIVECETDTDCAQDLKCMANTTGLNFTDPNDGDSSDPSDEKICVPFGFRYWGGSGAGVVAEESGVDGEFTGSDRVNWGGGGSEGGSSGGCSTIEGDVALSVFGLVGLIGWFRRRR